MQGRYSRETRRRTRVVQALPSVRSPGRLVGAVRCNEGEGWSRARYLSEGRMAESHAPRTSTEPQAPSPERLAGLRLIAERAINASLELADMLEVA